jgi:hypothetical protein
MSLVQFDARDSFATGFAFSDAWGPQVDLLG